MDSDYDDDRSGSYHPSSDDSSTNAETTPSQRVTKVTKMTELAKRRVDKVVTDKRCLLENTHESNLVEYAHCLPRSTKERMLDKLEAAWGLKKNSLNVDSRYNIIRLSPKFHKAFDANKWLLLPETWIIDAYYNARHTHKCPNIEAEKYKYTLIAHEDMCVTPIHRQRMPPPDAPMRLSVDDFTFYTYPYHDFPTIESHVHPRFIICNSGSKLVKGVFEWQKGREASTRDDLAKVEDIWKSWKSVDPTNEIYRKMHKDNDPDIEDDTSQRTGTRRVLRNKRRAAVEQASPTPKRPTPMGSKQRTLQDGGVWLDDATLHEFGRQTSSQDGLAIPKTDWILNWLKVSSGSKAEVQGKPRDSDDTMADGDSGHEDAAVIGGEA